MELKKKNLVWVWDYLQIVFRSEIYELYQQKHNRGGEIRTDIWTTTNKFSLLSTTLHIPTVFLLSSNKTHIKMF